MSVEALLELSETGEVVDIWRVADLLLDLRKENPRLADKALHDLGIQEDGPTIILGERIKKIVSEYQENLSEHT